MKHNDYEDLWVVLNSRDKLVERGRTVLQQAELHLEEVHSQHQTQLQAYQEQLCKKEKELRDIHEQLQQTHERFQQTHEQLQQAREQLQQAREQLQQQREKITAMESSKFWKLRAAWIRAKAAVGLSSE